jgi:hypothetical protein
MKAKTYRSEPQRPLESLRSAENWAIAVRKKLRAIERQRSGFRGIIDDAVKLAETIERLAVLAQTSPAEDAVEIKFHIELLSSLLEREIDQICAS